jgi:uncharacterized protein (DUF1499 family)
MTSAALLLALSLGASATSQSMQLKPCPKTPNCVSTQASNPDKQMDPIRYEGSLASARSTLLQILAQPRVEIVESTEKYVHAVFTTQIMKYQDDVEFLFDPDARTIHFRSASRVGTSDLGTNRRRMKALKKGFESARNE